MIYPPALPYRTTCLVVLGLLAAALSGCDGDRSAYRSPTGPADPLSPPPADATWYGSWSVDRAAPAGDCLAEALNSPQGGMSGWPFDLEFERDGDLARLRFRFGQGNDDSEGFWPLEFAGSVGADGAVRAWVPSERIGVGRTDPWGELCYWEWSMQGGELSATLSPDGRRLTGSIVESFRVASPTVQTTFSIHSHFTATAP